MLDTIVQEFTKTSEMHIHNTEPSLNPLPDFKLKKCHYARRCLCSKGPGRLLNLFEDKVVLFLQSLCPRPRHKKDINKNRLLLKFGNIVLRFHNEGNDTDALAVWFQVSFTNLSSWAMSWVKLISSVDADHLARALPNEVPLMVPHDCKWEDSWASLCDFDFDLVWRCDLYALVGSVSTITADFSAEFLQARRVTPESYMFWKGLHCADRRLVPSYIISFRFEIVPGGIEFERDVSGPCASFGAL